MGYKEGISLQMQKHKYFLSSTEATWGDDQDGKFQPNRNRGDRKDARNARDKVTTKIRMYYQTIGQGNIAISWNQSERIFTAGLLTSHRRLCD
jgi:hypothetical protein